MAGARRLTRAASAILWIVAVATTLATLGIITFPTSDQFLQMAATAGFGTVGLLITWRRPFNSVGWLMLGMGSLPAIAGIMGADVPVQNGAVLLCLALLLVVFPDGRVPARIWWWAASLPVLGWTLAAIAPDLVWTRSKDFTIPIGVILALVGVLWCGVAPFARRRRAGSTERLQLRWMGATATLTVCLAGVTFLGIALDAPEPLVGLGALMTALSGGLGIPISILVAVLRYRLYDIDRLISRTVTYALVIALLGGLYTGITLLLTQTLLGDSPVAVAISTLAVFATFTPLRRRIQRRVDRRFNRTRYRSEEEMLAFTGRLRESGDVEAVSLDLRGVIERTLQPSTLGLWIRDESEGKV